MTNNMATIFVRLASAGMAILLSGLVACDAIDPTREDTPELITRVTLTFTPQVGLPAVASATDPDGEGVKGMQVSGPIKLNTNSDYVLGLQLVDELVAPGASGYDLTAEVREESHEHLLFFSWTEGIFSNPGGNGNIDSRIDDVNYEDRDANGLPLGLETSWTTGSPSSGKFRVLLKHQPGLKSVNSSSRDGETDLDIEFDLIIE